MATSHGRNVMEVNFTRPIGQLSDEQLAEELSRQVESSGGGEIVLDLSNELSHLNDEEIAAQLARMGIRVDTVTATISNPRIVPDSLSYEHSPPPAATGRRLDLNTGYKYKPLRGDQFRLLSALGAGAFPLCEIKEHAFGNAPTYTAISYAWGKEVTTRAMFCNGESFAVSAHVLEALNNLCWIRPGDQTLNYWIDAICIDQHNAAEKAAQVNKMREIYCNAERVLVWLGPADDDSDLAIDNILAATMYARAKTAERYFMPSAEDMLARYPEPDPRVLPAIGRLFARQWFHRVWVIQEVLLARSILLVCGNRLIEWSTMIHLSDALSLSRLPLHRAHDGAETRFRITHGLSGLNQLNTLRSNGPVVNGLTSYQFTELLDRVRIKEVTHPVDRVWGILGVAPPAVRSAAMPFVDYSDHALRDYHTAYLNFVKVFLPTDQYLTLLSKAQSKTRPPGLPAWCPNFNARNQNGKIQFDNRKYHAGFEHDDGSPVQPPCISFPVHTNILKILGFRIDIVDKIIKPKKLTARDNIHQVHAKRRVWEEDCYKLAKKVYKQSSGVPDAHWRTLVADHLGTSPNRCAPDVLETYLHFRRFLQGPVAQDPELASLPDVKKGRFKLYHDSVIAGTMYNYFSTKDGRIGLGPCSMEPGDAVYIFYGAKAPHIVRFKSSRLLYKKAKQSPGQLVGDAYVHGLMYGEALSMGKQNEFIELE
jgi:hypothetical protein